MCSIWGGVLSLASILDFQHCTDEAQKAETVLSAVSFILHFNNNNARVRLSGHLIATLSFMPNAGQSSGNQSVDEDFTHFLLYYILYILYSVFYHSSCKLDDVITCLVCIIQKNVNISQMKKDIPKRKTPLFLFFFFWRLSNKQQSFFIS